MSVCLEFMLNAFRNVEIAPYVVGVSPPTPKQEPKVCALDDKELDEIIKKIGNKDKTTTTLKIENKQLKADQVSKLVEALITNSTITHLCLANTELDDQCAFHIARLIGVNSAITFIDLSKNNISQHGLRVLKHALEKNFKIIYFNIRGNPHGQINQECFNQLTERNQKTQHQESNSELTRVLHVVLHQYSVSSDLCAIMASYGTETRPITITYTQHATKQGENNQMNNNGCNICANQSHRP